MQLYTLRSFSSKTLALRIHMALQGYPSTTQDGKSDNLLAVIVLPIYWDVAKTPIRTE